MLQHVRPILLCLLLGGCATFGPARHGETIHANEVYAVRDGKRLHVDLYVPPTKQPAPVIVWIHGGGWKYGDKGYSLAVRDLTRDGFAIASVQYRLLWGAPWPAQIDDCTDAVAWLRKNGRRYGIDGSRLGVAGESAGGHLAALIGTRQGRPRVRGVFAMFPPTDLVRMGRRFAHYGRFSIFSQMFDGEIADRRTEARAASPLTYVRRNSPPFLLLHGDEDWLVPQEQSELLHDALQKSGVESELLIVNGQGHAFDLNETQLRQVAAFFRKHL